MSIFDFLLSREDRPLGIALLSALNFVGGVLLCGLMIWGAMRFNEPRFTEGITKLGVPTSAIAASVGFLAILGIISGIGMWKGTQWGWYVGSFYFLYAIIRNLNALLMVNETFALFADEEPLPVGQGPEYYHFKFGFRALISLFLYFYFFKGNVLSFFGLKQSKLWPLVVCQIAMCLTIVATATAWYAFSG